jgi:hypothetical protein
MIVYPSNLPSPLIRAYSAQDSELFIRDNVNVGPISYALDSIDGFTEFDVSFGLSGKEKEAFTDFVEVTLSDRSRSFEIELDNQGETITALCYMGNVNYSSVGKRWNASTTLTMVKVL